MTGGAIAMALFGAVVLWGGVAYCLRIAMKNQ